MLIKEGLADELGAKVCSIEPVPPMRSGPLTGAQRESSIVDVAGRISNAIQAAIREGDFPVVIGGDHTSAIGFHTGLGEAYGETGIVWMDTHSDLNTPSTSPSGNMHGMVLAGLLGKGSDAMVKATAAGHILEEHIGMVGIRATDTAEQQWIDTGRMHCMTMDDVRERGLDQCLADAVRTADGADAGYGLTIDLDVIDPSQAPFVATPVDGGIDAKELVSCLSTFQFSNRLLGLEVTEFTPRNDEDVHFACKLVTNIVKAVTDGDV